jgi:hypothetical protein
VGAAKGDLGEWKGGTGVGERKREQGEWGGREKGRRGSGWRLLLAAEGLGFRVQGLGFRKWLAPCARSWQAGLVALAFVAPYQLAFTCA